MKGCKQNKSDGRDAWNKVKAVASWIAVLFSVSGMLFFWFAIRTGGKDAYSLFGYYFFTAKTNLMAATDFSAGDLVISQSMSDTSMLSEGDIISFVSLDKQQYGKVVTRKIREINVDEQGNRVFVTYGAAASANDAVPVAEKFVIGEYKFSIPKLGFALDFIKTPTGYITCVLAPLLVVIVWNDEKEQKITK